jgi:sporulation protein YlmC with PRC-barrel domain
MQVYNPNGVFVGSIQDVDLPVGEGEISVQVLTKYRAIENVKWSNVGPVGDIVILKSAIELKAPAVPQQPTPSVPSPMAPPAPEQKGFFSRVRGKSGGPQKCPTCGADLTWVEQYQRWYCSKESKYA